MATVPDLYRLTQAEAEAAILAANLTVGTVTEDEDLLTEIGMVYDQDPAAEAVAVDEDPVDFSVNIGVDVPSLTGLTLDEAKTQLASSNLVLSGAVKTKTVRDTERGIIVEQFPAAGVRLRAGSEVLLTVAERYVRRLNR